MESFSLKNPPIREAVIEIRFIADQSFTIPQIEEFSKLILESYPEKTQFLTFDVNVNTDSGEAITQQNVAGLRLSNPNGSFVIILKNDSLVISHLRPYSNFLVLKSELVRILSKLMNFTQIISLNRVAVRYINEFSFTTEVQTKIADYIRLAPAPIEGLENQLIAYTMQIRPFHNSKQIILQVALEPQLINNGFYNVLFDIDVIHDQTMNGVEDLFVILDELRMIKNDIFANNIGSKALELFNN